MTSVGGAGSSSQTCRPRPDAGAPSMLPAPRDVVDMDAAEDLAGLDDALRAPLAHGCARRNPAHRCRRGGTDGLAGPSASQPLPAPPPLPAPARARRTGSARFSGRPTRRRDRHRRRSSTVSDPTQRRAAASISAACRSTPHRRAGPAAPSSRWVAPSSTSSDPRSGGRGRTDAFDAGRLSSSCLSRLRQVPVMLHLFGAQVRARQSRCSPGRTEQKVIHRGTARPNRCALWRTCNYQHPNDGSPPS